MDNPENPTGKTTDPKDTSSTGDPNKPKPLPGSEPLLAGSGVRLFGQLVTGLKLDLNAAHGNLGSLKRLADRLGGEGQLARIYGFSHEGQYYDLTRPTIFLVDGAGVPAGTSIATTALAAMPPRLTDDVLVWDCDRSDFTLRLDLDLGPFERVLLDAELGPEEARLSFGGQQARANYGGQQVRLRYAGQQVRLQGGRGGGMGD
jgi:hypothetical protein